jgi:zinc transport system permease protein
MILAAVAVGVGMQVVGILLVAALMVLPVGVARNLVSGFRNVLIVSAVIGAASAFAGLLVADAADTAASGTIVLLLAGCFVLSDLARRFRAALGSRSAAASSAV